MSLPIDEATSRFLKTAAADLQRHLGKAGMVEGLTIDNRSIGVSLVLQVRVGSRVLDFRAGGENLLDAYATLTRDGAAAIVSSTFEQVLEVYRPT